VGSLAVTDPARRHANHRTSCRRTILAVDIDRSKIIDILSTMLDTAPDTDRGAQDFRALSDPTRLRILDLLAEGERCVCDVVAAMDVAQPLLSHHLKILRQAGFIHARKEGRWMYYRLDPERLEACVCVLEGSLRKYDAAAEQGKPGCACR
jgi:ArsR family transcriptional regulator